MACLITFSTVLAICLANVNSTPFKRQTDFWNSNNELGNNWQGGFPSNIPSNNFGPSWGGDRPIWGSDQPERPSRPIERPQRPNRLIERPQRPERPSIRPQRPATRPTTARPTTTTTSSDSTTPSIPPFVTLHVPPEGCPCSRTGQFNPVCGTDYNTYANEALLNCYKNCGTNVNMRYMGSCRRSG